ncbi:hypothetical protein AtubIFM56815_001389 [Aspergillus tubingensis]|uniref:Nephrocystin 3-like N-terminal domain-containing protein n=1 Tax=Aspergillus tubingensis TaxID=5068 RepID=A0A9W6EIQ2_ASPTU|nr:hypothetical protein AtubIFM56815_001389 [Aspergillus tubingensis]
MESTGLFLSSRITLRTRIISIYANPETPGKIDSAFDESTAVLGICTELALPEESTGEAHSPLTSRLSDMVFNGSCSWNRSSSRTAIERTLLSMALPHRQFLSTRVIDSHPVFRSSEYKLWKTSRGPQILYIHGENQRLTTEAAEQVILAWQRERFDKNLYDTEVHSFSFSRYDRARNSMDAIVSTLLVYSFSRLAEGVPNFTTWLLENQGLLQHGWTDKDLQNILCLMLRDHIESTMLCLQNADDCNTAESRKVYWKAIAKAYKFTDMRPKLLITSRRPDALKEELQLSAPNMTLHCYRVGVGKPHDCELGNCPREMLISRLCPCEHGKAYMQARLKELASMNCTVLSAIMDIISSHTGWPEVTSSQTHLRFDQFFSRLSVHSTTQSVLEDILCTLPDRSWIRSTLTWSLCGYRPLSYQEMAMFCRYQLDPGVEQLLVNIESSIDQPDMAYWMKGLLEPHQNQVCIRQEILEVFARDGDSPWTEIRSNGPQQTCWFLYRFLTSARIQRQLLSIYHGYQERVYSSKEHITPPLVSDGQDIIYYATESFPYHLSKAPLVLQEIAPVLLERNGPLSAWMKVYWAMQNPFSRPKLSDLDPAGVSLLTLGLQSFGLHESLSQSGHELPIRVAGLSEAMRVGDEDAVLYYLNQSHGSLSVSLLWRAVFLDMARVVDTLLKYGMDPNPSPDPDIFYPSPLYLACSLDHCQIVQTLLKGGANINILMDGYVGIMFKAAAEGADDTIRAIAAVQHTLLDAPQPYTPLYAACSRGSWKTVETLVQLGASVDLRFDGNNAERGWQPLCIAALYGYPRTIRSLLDNEADPNLRGLGANITALSLAVCESGDPECVRLLLGHGANPNHELHQPVFPVFLSQETTQLDAKLEILDVLVNHSNPIDVNAVDNCWYRAMTPLMYAAASGDCNLVRWLLSHGANIALVDEKKQNALFHAVEGHHNSVVQLLLEQGSSLIEKNTQGTTMLELAIEEVSILQLLLDAGADPELESSDGSTAINKAASQGQVDSIRVLIRRGVNVHHRDDAGWSPLLDACGTTPNEEAVRILLESGARSTDTTPGEQTPLHQAAIKGQLDILKILLEYRNVLNIDAQDNEKDTALAAAVRCNELECVVTLIRAGANINLASHKGWTVFLYALVLERPPELINMLLSQSDLDIHSVTEGWGAAIHIACQHLQLDTVDKLISRGADVNQRITGPNSTPLISIFNPRPSGKINRQESLDRQEHLVRELVQQGADISAEHGFIVYNPLSAACLGTGRRIINYLLYKGASLQLRDPLGRLAIHFAAANGLENFEAVNHAAPRLLMAPDKAKKIPLHWAAQFGRAQTVEAILNYVRLAAERRRYVNETDIDGWTPLCWALRPTELFWDPNMPSEPANYAETVRFLLENGADPTVRCRMGSEHDLYTPLQLARLHDAPDKVIELLQESLGSNIPDSQDPSTKVYNRPYGYFCGICFTCIYGIAYDCSICQNFLACRKCYGQIDIYLGDRPVPGPDAHVHKFQLWDSDEPEFQKTWPTSPSDVNEGLEASSLWSSHGLDNHAGSDANDLILENPPGSVGSSTGSGYKKHDSFW